MYRKLNFSPASYPCPEGNMSAAGMPIWNYRPDYIYHDEIICKSRPIQDILGFYDMRTTLLGPFPGELFNQQWLTTKPHSTFITFHKDSKLNMYDHDDCSRLEPSQLMGEFSVAEVLHPKTDISVEDLKKCEICSGKALLIRTDISKSHRDIYPTADYYTNYPGLSYEAAEYLVNKGVTIIGIDVRNIEPIDPAKRGKISVTQLFNDAGIPVIQDMANIGEIKPKMNWLIVGIPLKLVGLSGGPARVVAVNSDNPEEFQDLSFKLKTYPSSRYDRKHGWMEPLPKRIDPRDQQYFEMKKSRLIPFRLIGEDVRTPDGTSTEMYIFTHHSTNSHAECAYFDPCHVHNLSDEILCKYKEMPLERMIAPACQINLAEIIGPRQTLDVDVLENSNVDICEGDIVFIRTEINDWYMWNGNGMDSNPGFTISAARWLVDKKVRAVAIDFTSPERSNPPSGVAGMHYTSNEVHYLWHKNNICVIERVLRFNQIVKERFNCAILPLPAHNLGGFPCDVYGWEKWD